MSPKLILSLLVCFLFVFQPQLKYLNPSTLNPNFCSTILCNSKVPIFSPLFSRPYFSPLFLAPIFSPHIHQSKQKNKPTICRNFIFSFVMESMRWLHLNGKTDDVMKLLDRIAKLNNKKLPKIELVPLKNDQSNGLRHFLNLFRPMKIAVRSLIQGYTWYVSLVLGYLYNVSLRHHCYRYTECLKKSIPF